MPLQFGVFDHIEPVPNTTLDKIYNQRLAQIKTYDAAGCYGYHLAEHHTTAVHRLSTSPNAIMTHGTTPPL